MPVDSKVHKLYEALMGQGMSQESAVKIAQKKTGQALATGKPPKGKRKKASRRRKKGQSSGKY
jgi:hypothetical protein